MIIKEALKKYREELRGVSETPFLDTEILLSFTLGKNKTFLYTYPEKKLTQQEIKKFERLIQKRKRNYPIAYLLKQKEFYRNLFFVDERVLIPRCETEILVEETIKIIKKEKGKINFLEIGTGSGAIIASIILDIGKDKFNKIFATDISTKALEVASENLKKLKLEQKIKLLESDLLEKIKDQDFEIMVANLPYLSSKEYEDLSCSEVLYEPKIALVSQKNGTYLIEKLIKTSFLKLKKKGFLILEIGKGQKEILNNFLKNSKKWRIYFVKDLQSIERVAILRKQE
jgi:release factor glutamine methyltransferase